MLELASLWAAPGTSAPSPPAAPSPPPYVASTITIADAAPSAAQYPSAATASPSSRSSDRAGPAGLSEVLGSLLLREQLTVSAPILLECQNHMRQLSDRRHRSKFTGLSGLTGTFDGLEQLIMAPSLPQFPQSRMNLMNLRVRFGWERLS